MTLIFFTYILHVNLELCGMKYYKTILILSIYNKKVLIENNNIFSCEYKYSKRHRF